MVSPVLRLLVEAEGSYVSGQQMSRQLGMTRAAVWKKIAALRDKGFAVEAAPSRGYRLTGVPDLSPEYILLRAGDCLWKDLIFSEAVASTNESAMARCADSPQASGVVFLAEAQHRGRGRLGRSWVSPQGKSVLMSLLLRPGLAPKDASVLTLLAGVACAAAVRDISRLPAMIKWPNDILVEGRKLGGILTEVRSDPDRVLCAVVGIGINVTAEAGDFPAEIREQATSLLIETGVRWQRNELIVSILRSFEHWYGILGSEGKAPVFEAWRSLSATLGNPVRVAMPAETLVGNAEDIDENGMLRIRLDDGTSRTISAGDVTHLRPA